MEDTQDDRRLVRGVIWKTFTHKYSLASPSSSTPTLQPTTNHTSFCVSRGQNGGQPAPPCSSLAYSRDSDYQQGDGILPEG